MSALSDKPKEVLLRFRLPQAYMSAISEHCKEQGISKKQFYVDAMTWFLGWYEEHGEGWRPESIPAGIAEREELLDFLPSGVNGSAMIVSTLRDSIDEIVRSLCTKKVTLVSNAVRLYCEHVGIEPEPDTKRVVYELGLEAPLKERVHAFVEVSPFSSVPALFEHLVKTYAQWRFLETETPLYWSSPTKSIGTTISIEFNEATYSKVQMLSMLDDVERGDVLYTALLRFLDGEL